jgi:hypothetical protein
MSDILLSQYLTTISICALVISRMKVEKWGISGHSCTYDCKPGGTVPVCNTDMMTIFVSDPLGSQTLRSFCMGSYKSFGADAPKVPYFAKKITGNPYQSRKIGALSLPASKQMLSQLLF